MITVPSGQSARSRSALAIGAVALCASLAACSNSGGTTSAPAQNAQPTGTSQPPPATASRSACGLVTISEVTTATGKSMAAGNGAGDICGFSAIGDPSLVVYIQIYANAETLAVAKHVVSGGQHLAGLGDDAFWTVGGNLFVQKGNRGFTISLPSLALTSHAPPKILALANAALARF